MNALKSVVIVAICVAMIAINVIPVHAQDDDIPYFPVFGLMERAISASAPNQNRCEAGNVEITPFYPTYPFQEVVVSQLQNPVFLPLTINGILVSGPQCLPSDNLLNGIAIYLIDQQGNRRTIAPIIKDGEFSMNFVEGMETSEETSYPLTITLSYTDVLAFTKAPTLENVSRLGILAVIPHSNSPDELLSPFPDVGQLLDLLQPPTEGPVDPKAVRVANTMAYMQDQLTNVLWTSYEPILPENARIYSGPNHQSFFTTPAESCPAEKLAENGGLPVDVAALGMFPDARTGTGMTWWAFVTLTQDSREWCLLIELEEFHWIPGPDAFNYLSVPQKQAIWRGVDDATLLYPRFSMPMAPNPSYSPPQQPISEEVVMYAIVIGAVVVIIIVIVGVTIFAPEMWFILLAPVVLAQSISNN